MSHDLTIGVVGTGAIGRTHIERINTRLQGAKVVACADANQTFCQSVAEQYGLQAFASGEELITSPTVEAVLCATADPFHETYVLAAIAAGKPIFCEKPLAPKAEACQRIVEAEMTSGKHLVQVGFMRRFDPGYQQLKKLIDSGRYGSPLMLHCAHRNYDDGGVGFTTPMSVENSMIHEIDVLRWLVGERYVKAEVVFPRTSKNACEGFRDPQILYLTTESGIRIDVESFVFSHYGYDIKCEVVCEEGTLNLPEPPNVMVRTNDARVTPICHDWSERFVEAYNIELQQWINACNEGRNVDGPTAWDGYLAQITAARASAARDAGHPMEIVLPDTPAFYAD